MTIAYPQALAAIKSGSAPSLRLTFESLTIPEMVELGTFIGPRRLREVTWSTPPFTAFRPRETTLDTVSVLTEINRQAFNVAPRALGPLQPDPAIAPAVRAALLSVATRRRAGPLLRMTEDVTNTLSRPASVPAALGDADYAAAAARQAVEVAAIKAVAIVESGGRSGFDAAGQPKILFEAHHFSRHTANRYNLTHPHLSVPRAEWRTSRRYYGWDQYQRLREAMVLDIDAALQSASWGKFQVMGSNHSGWNDVRSFVAAMYVSEANHLRSFEAYCNDRNLLRFVRSQDWLSFARGYNGQNQQGYDQRIAAAFTAAGGVAQPRARAGAQP